MRHVVIRGILALIWLAAAAVSGLSGNLEWAGLYVLMGAAFGYSAWASWKKAKKFEMGDTPKEINIFSEKCPLK